MASLVEGFQPLNLSGVIVPKYDVHGLMKSMVVLGQEGRSARGIFCYNLLPGVVSKCDSAWIEGAVFEAVTVRPHVPGDIGEFGNQCSRPPFGGLFGVN